MGEDIYVRDNLFQELVDFLTPYFHKDPLEITTFHIVFPTLRGCQKFKDYFIEKHPEPNGFLPRLTSLADVLKDPYQVDFVPLSAPLTVIDFADRLSLSLSVTERLCHLQGWELDFEQRLSMARHFLKLIDDAYDKDLDLTKVSMSLKEKEFTTPNRKLMGEFLATVLEIWPTLVNDMGCIEEKLLLKDLTEKWEKSWSFYPIKNKLILAGFETDTPIVVNFLKAARKYANATCFIKKYEKDPLPKGDLYFIDTKTPQDQAQAIAKEVGKVLGQGGEKIVIATPDATFSSLIQTALNASGISSNSAHGTPLPQTVVGSYALLTVKLFKNSMIQEILAVLKHPLTQKGQTRYEFLEKVREFEQTALRGKFKAPSWHQLLDWGHLVPKSKTLPLKEWVRVHQELMIFLSREDLWDYEDGHKTKDFLDLFSKADSLEQELSAYEYETLLQRLIKLQKVSDLGGVGSKVFIIHPRDLLFEAGDCFMLATLHEGVWPLSPPYDPWLSEREKIELGIWLENEEYHESLKALTLAFDSKKCYFFKSQEEASGPIAPSVFWYLYQKHQTPITKNPSAQSIKPSVQQGKVASINVPLSIRPKEISVTDVELLKRDPYGFYAKKILKLKKLEDITPEFGPRERGIILHRCLSWYLKEKKDITQLVLKEFEDLTDQKEIISYWVPRCIQVLSHVVPLLEKYTQDHFFESEKKKYLELEGIQLHTRPDLIVYEEGGQMHLIDFKTGSVPLQKEVFLGYSPQLPLEALIIDQPCLSLQYWHLKEQDCVITSLKNPTELIQNAQTGLSALLQHYLLQENPFERKKKSRYISSFDPYAHLARSKG